MMKRERVRHRSKVAAKHLPDFCVKLNADTGERLSHLAVRWTMITMARTQETRFVEFEEFEGMDGDDPLWRLSPERMKMRLGHIVPLPRQATAPFHEIRDLNIYRKAGDMRLGRTSFRYLSRSRW